MLCNCLTYFLAAAGDWYQKCSFVDDFNIENALAKLGCNEAGPQKLLEKYLQNKALVGAF